jgi:hypothetical protein
MPPDGASAHPAEWEAATWMMGLKLEHAAALTKGLRRRGARGDREA